VKAAYHDVYGNVFAAPASFDAALLAGTLEPRTRLFEAGVQFAF
jgi:hypothetical protein